MRESTEAAMMQTKHDHRVLAKPLRAGQDKGGFERWGNNSRPGDWDPWILAMAGIWALAAVGLLAVRQVLERPTGTR